MTVSHPVSICGATTTAGTPCKLRAGHGTDHVGAGHCRRHGGNTPNGRTYGNRGLALNFARGALGQELDIDPLEGVLLAVKLGYGIVDYWRHQLHQPDANHQELHENYSHALMDYTRICDIAVKAGVAERQIKIVERAADQLSLLYEEVANAMGASVEQRQLGAEAWARGLAQLEGPPIIDGTAQDLAA